jgi:predicted permease
MPGVLRGALKAIVEVISMMSEGTLPLQTLVLAASLLQKPEQQQQQQQQEVELVNTKGEAILAMNNNTTTNVTTTNNNVKGNTVFLLSSFSSAITRIKLLLLPSSGEEARALAIISLTRFLLLPLATATALFWATRLGWLGLAGVDPVLLFVILVQSVMPSAQNLIIVLQLSDQTRSSAPAYAKMLLKLYAAAIVPVTLWVTAFASNLKVPLA